jgi:hypothetical protein
MARRRRDGQALFYVLSRRKGLTQNPGCYFQGRLRYCQGQANQTEK